MVRFLSLMALFVLLCGSGVAMDFGNRAPDKPIVTVTPPPVDPEVVRQGGDTILDAVMVTIPVVHLTGTTAGYTDDYDEACPYQDSTSPDGSDVFEFDYVLINNVIIDPVEKHSWTGVKALFD